MTVKITRRSLLAGTGTAILAAQSAFAVAQAAQIQLGFVYWETKTDAFVQMANGGSAVAALDPTVNLLTAAPDTGDPQSQAALSGVGAG